MRIDDIECLNETLIGSKLQSLACGLLLRFKKKKKKTKEIPSISNTEVKASPSLAQQVSR